ncbi:ferredoxin [Clostridia bacterium]|nr:ferredoxin [Clostridia bacterium]
MKSLAELNAVRDKTRAQMGLDNNAKSSTRILVGMATCGIAAGARPIHAAFESELKTQGAKDAAVIQTGCIGMCRLEPMVEVFAPNKEKVTYVKVTPDMVGRIVAEHIIGGQIVKEYTVGAAEQ